MLTSKIRRILDAYPAIYLACHRRHVRDDADGRVISQHQASILDHLHPTQPKTLSELAEHMGVTRSTMSVNVARLVQHGYVVSRRSESDARRLSLTLTPNGIRVAESNTVLDPELVGELIRLIPATEVEAALAGFERLARSAQALLRQRKRGSK